MLVSYLLLAVAAGYSSVWLWGMVNHSFEGWQRVAWRCAAYFPGITLLIMSLLNFLIVHTGSSGAIPLGAFFSLLALWFLISIPLCFSGTSSPSALQPLETDFLPRMSYRDASLLKGTSQKHASPFQRSQLESCFVSLKVQKKDLVQLSRHA